MNVIRMVKLFGWEGRMLERLQDKREQEIRLLWRIKVLNLLTGMLGFVFPILTMVALFAVYTLVMKQELTCRSCYKAGHVKLLTKCLYQLLRFSRA